MRAFLGDRLRAEGWFDDAASAYAVLEELAARRPRGRARLGLAHAGAGRLDIAERMLARVAQTGGRAGDAQLGELASTLGAVLVAEARSRPGLRPEDSEPLLRVALEMARDERASVVLVRGPSAALPLDVKLVRGPQTAREERAPQAAAQSLGLFLLKLDPGAAKLVIRRPAELVPARATRVRIDVLLPAGKSQPPRLTSIERVLPIDGKPVEIDWNGNGFAK